MAVSRQGRRSRARIGDIRLRIGDVLLLQGPAEELQSALAVLGCLPLAEPNIRLGRYSKLLHAIVIFGIAPLIFAISILSVQVSFVMAALTMGLSGIITPDEAYKSIDQSVIILLGAMIPVGQALEITRGESLIADAILDVTGVMPIFVILVTLMTITMLVSCVMNNAAAAVLMAPMAANIALTLGTSVDPFLMAVGVAASSAFLMTIGHQSSMLVRRPGGYRFSDYWRVGLPLQIIVIVLAIPLITLFWSF